MSAAAILEKAEILAAARRGEKLKQYAILLLTDADAAYLEQMRRTAGDLSRTAFIRSLIREIVADDKAAEGK